MGAATRVSRGRLWARRRFQADRFGMFIHWGIYSLLGDGEWVMENRGIPADVYAGLAERFNPVRFDPGVWVATARRAGMRHITVTSRHHDGFPMWDSRVDPHNVARATPYRRDVIRMLANACERQGMRLFLYYSLLDWRHPHYFPRGATGHRAVRPDRGQFRRYVDYMKAQLTELLGGDYGEIAGIWFDGWWDQQVKRVPQLGRPDAPPLEMQVDWCLGELYDLIHRLQPSALIGNNHHVAPFPGEDFQMFEKDLPGANTAGFSEDARIGDLPLETCETINGAWGYSAADTSHKSTDDLIRLLVRAAGMDSNLLLNVGPTSQGLIQPEFVRRLHAVGDWLEHHFDSVYSTRGGPVPPQAWGVTTQNDSTVYVHVLDPPTDGVITLPGIRSGTIRSARMLNGGGVVRLLPADPPALKLTGLIHGCVDTVVALEVGA